MGFIIGLLTAVLVITCIILVLLVLIQLPKKEAGLGQAFGSGATDALFGAGSGTALTKMTKYAAGIFFVLVLVLAVINAHQSKARRGGQGLRDALSKIPAAEAGTPSAAATKTTNPPVKVTVPALNLTNLPVPGAVVVPPVVATNAPAAAQPK